MFKKPLISAIAVIALCFSVGITAFADETDTELLNSNVNEEIAVYNDISENETDSENDNFDTENIVSELTSEIIEKAASSDSDANTDTDSNSIPDYFGDDMYDTKGNLSLIREERIIYDNEEMQFIAVTTKDGHVFYILIDYTAIRAAENGEEGADARQTVYFLNKVDDYDLFTLLYDNTDNDEVTPYMPNTYYDITDNQSEAESQPEDSEESKSSPSVPTWAVMIAFIALVGVGYWFFKLRPNGSKKDSIDDDDFDFDDEEINEDNESEAE